MSEDLLDRAKKSLECFEEGATKGLIDELIAEVEATRANNGYLQKMTEEAQQIMQESQLLLCVKANEAEQLQKEVERLRSFRGRIARILDQSPSDCDDLLILGLDSRIILTKRQAARIAELEEAIRCKSVG